MKTKKIVKLLLPVFIIITVFLSACTYKTPKNPVENGAENNIIDENNDNNDSNAEDMKLQALVNLNVRSEPATDSTSKVLGTISKNQTVDFIQQYDENWYEIVYNGDTAYVSAKSSYAKILTADELRELQNTIDEDAKKAEQARLEAERKAEQARIERINKIDAIINAGKSKLGTPYLFGAVRLLTYEGTVNSNFTGKNFDCSSFVQYAFYKGAGIKLLGDSRSQSTKGSTISLSNLQKGDLIFMTSTDRMNNTGIERIGHVVIYLGDNKILHTYGTPGVIVQEYSSFWRSRAISAKRMF